MSVLDQAAEQSAWLKLAEAAVCKSVSQRTLNREIAAGRLRAYRVGHRQVRIAADDVDRWDAERHGGDDAA